jgi:hypothetical protein
VLISEFLHFCEERHTIELEILARKSPIKRRDLYDDTLRVEPPWGFLKIDFPCGDFKGNAIVVVTARVIANVNEISLHLAYRSFSAIAP